MKKTKKEENEEVMETKEPKNIFQRINAVMLEVDYIQKGEKKVAGQYRFCSHDQVTAALHGPMAKHGIACIPTIAEMKQDSNRTEVKLEVSFINIDSPADRFSVFYWGYGIDTSDKGIGKAVSYAFKYALLKTFVLETGDDPDQDQSSKYEPKKEPAPEVPKMSAIQVRILTQALGDDVALNKKVLGYLEKMGCASLEMAPAEKFDGLLKYINGQKMTKKEDTNGNTDFPEHS